VWHHSGCKEGVSEQGLTIQGKGVDVLTVVSEDHVFLTKPDGVFALRDTIKFFERGFRDALGGSDQ
jgi:hypothetical protein